MIDDKIKMMMPPTDSRSAEDRRSECNGLLSDRVAYAIFLVMMPKNMCKSDWVSGAILGADNAFRNKINLAAKLAVIEMEMGA